MKNDIKRMWVQLEQAAGEEQRRLFVTYCIKLIGYKEQGRLTAEEAAYKMVGAIQFDNLASSPALEAIFDIAGRTELPRTASYAQPIGGWNRETADKIKEKEWGQLVIAVKNAERLLD